MDAAGILAGIMLAVVVTTGLTWLAVKQPESRPVMMNVGRRLGPLALAVILGWIASAMAYHPIRWYLIMHGNLRSRTASEITVALLILIVLGLVGAAFAIPASAKSGAQSGGKKPDATPATDKSDDKKSDKPKKRGDKAPAR